MIHLRKSRGALDGGLKSHRHRSLPLVRSAGGTTIVRDHPEVTSAVRSAPGLPGRSGGKIAEMRGGVHQDEPADLVHRHRLLANQGLHLEFLLPPTPTLSRSPQGAAVVAVVLLACLPLLADMSPHLPTWCLHRRTQLNLLERRSTGSWKRDLRRREGAAPPAEGEVRKGLGRGAGSEAGGEGAVSEGRRMTSSTLAIG